jgi:hypothetical protein
MNASEILDRVGAQRGIHPMEIAKKIHDHIGEPGGDFDKHNDTLLFHKPLSHDAAFVHFVTQDSPLNLIGSLTFFIHELRKKGIKTIYLKTESRSIINALKSVGVQLMHSDIPKYNLMAHV